MKVFFFAFIGHYIKDVKAQAVSPATITSSHRSVRIPLPPCMSSLNGARAATMRNAAGPFLGASYPCSHLCDIYVQHCLGWAVSTPKKCWYKLVHRVTLNLWISTKHVKLYSTITLLARCRFYWHVFVGVVSLFGAPFGSTKGYMIYTEDEWTDSW